MTRLVTLNVQKLIWVPINAENPSKILIGMVGKAVQKDGFEKYTSISGDGYESRWKCDII